MTDMPKRVSGKKALGIIIIIFIALVLLIVGSNCFFTLSEGFVAARYTLNKLDSIETATGIHFKIPFIQDIKHIDVREQSIEISLNAYTRDTQTVEDLVVKINYRLDSLLLAKIIQETGVDEIYKKIIEPNVFFHTRNTIGQYAADALIGHRAEVAQIIEDQLKSNFAEKGVALTSFTIQNIDFENSFEEAVRRKVEAEQRALEAQNQTKEKEELGKQQVIAAEAEADAIKAKAEAEAFSIRATAEAEAYAIEIVNNATADAEAYAAKIIREQLIDNPDYIQYLYAMGWNGQLPTVQGEGVSPIVDIR